MRGEEGVEGVGLAFKYRLTSCTVQFTNKHFLTFLPPYLHFLHFVNCPNCGGHFMSNYFQILLPVSFHTDVTIYEPRSPLLLPPLPPPLLPPPPPPSPPFGSRFFVTGVGMSEGRVGVVDDDDDVVVVVGAVVVVTSVLLFLGLGV